MLLIINSCRFGKHDLSKENQWPRIGPNQRFQTLALIGKYSLIYFCFKFYPSPLQFFFQVKADIQKFIKFMIWKNKVNVP